MKAPFPGCGTFKGFFVILAFGALLAAPAAAGEHSLGLGAHFWKTVDEIADDGGFSGIEDDGYALVVSYRYEPGGLVFFQLEVDYYADGYGGSTETAYTPMAFIGVGRTFYLAAGIAVTHTDEFTSDDFYLGRIGWNLDLLPGIGIDLSATYQIDAFSEIDQLKSDATTLGAVVRFSF